MKTLINNTITSFRNRPDFQREHVMTWEMFLKYAYGPSHDDQCLGVVRRVTEADNYLGLTRPLHATCNLCTNIYNAVIHMETYHHDSRWQPTSVLMIMVTSASVQDPPAGGGAEPAGAGVPYE